MAKSMLVHHYVGAPSQQALAKKADFIDQAIVEIPEGIPGPKIERAIKALTYGAGRSEDCHVDAVLKAVRHRLPIWNHDGDGGPCMNQYRVMQVFGWRA